jgi:photoactive yellow protein
MTIDEESGITIGDPDLVARVEQLSQSQIDRLPFGVIRLDPAGHVTRYSRTEARQSGFGERSALGRAFFSDLAPCMATPHFLRRIESARADGTLDVTFEQVGDFADDERELRVRMASSSDRGLWVFIQRLS